jgi:hypothetical protein
MVADGHNSFIGFRWPLASVVLRHVACEFSPCDHHPDAPAAKMPVP